MCTRVLCAMMLLATSAFAQSFPAGSAPLQAEWDRYFPRDEQQALAAVKDDDRTDVEHRAFFVLLDAAAKLTEEQLKAAPEVTDIDDLLANPKKYRGRLVSFYVAVRRTLRPEDRIHRASGETVTIHSTDCTAKKGYVLRAWTREAGGRVAPNEGLLVRGFFYKTFRYAPEGARDRDETQVGLGIVSRYVKKADTSQAFSMPAWVPWLLVCIFAALVAVAVVAFVLSRRPRRAAPADESPAFDATKPTE